MALFYYNFSWRNKRCCDIFSDIQIYKIKYKTLLNKQMMFRMYLYDKNDDSCYVFTIRKTNYGKFIISSPYRREDTFIEITSELNEKYTELYSKKVLSDKDIYFLTQLHIQDAYKMLYGEYLYKRLSKDAELLIRMLQPECDI